MELSDAVRRRRMVRNYDPARAVSKEALTALLDLAARAPSAGFSQGRHFLVLERHADRDLFWAATTDADHSVGNRWLTGMRNAPVLIIALSDKQAYLDRYAEPDKGWLDRDEQRWPAPYWDIDTGMACMILMLAAVDHGLATCFFGIPPEHHEDVRRTFGIPDRLGLVGVLSLGYPRPDHRSPSLRRGRRPLTEMVSGGRFGSPVAYLAYNDPASRPA